MRRIFFLSVVFLFLSAHVFAENEKQATKALPEIIFPAMLTGNFAVPQGLFDQGRLLAEELSGKSLPFRWEISDCQTDPMKAITEYKKGRQSGNAVGAVSIRGPIGMALNPLSKIDGVPLLGVVGNKKFRLENPYAFQIWVPSDREGQFYADELIKRGITNASLIYMEDDWFSAVAEEFVKAYKSKGGKILDEISVLPTDQDFYTLSLKLRSKKPGAVVMFFSPAQAGNFVKSYRRDDRETLLVSNYMITTKDALDIAGKEASNGILVVEISEDLPSLQKEATLRGKKIVGVGVAGYVITQYLLEAFEVNPGIARPKDLYEALMKVKRIRLPGDEFLEVVDRNPLLQLKVFRLVNGEKLPV